MWLGISPFKYFACLLDGAGLEWRCWGGDAGYFGPKILDVGGNLAL